MYFTLPNKGFSRAINRIKEKAPSDNDGAAAYLPNSISWYMSMILSHVS